MPATRCACQPWIARPSKVPVPASGPRKPEIRSMAVLFPAPLGPISPTMALGMTVRLQSTTACTPPKLLASPRTSSSGAPGSAIARGSHGHRDHGPLLAPEIAGSRLGEQALGPEAQHDEDEQATDEAADRWEK